MEKYPSLPIQLKVKVKDKHIKYIYSIDSPTFFKQFCITLNIHFHIDFAIIIRYLHGLAIHLALDKSIRLYFTCTFAILLKVQGSLILLI